MKAKRKTRHSKKTTTCNNKLNRCFQESRPLEKVVTDITYFPFGRKVLYLSSVMDLYNDEIIVYTIGDRQDSRLVIDTLNQLPELSKSCILHSDQGDTYTSLCYQQLVKAKGIIMSMSRKGTPVDNSPIESFHSSLKSETFYLQTELKSSTNIVAKTVLQYIDYYNNFRIQQKLGYLSPVEFRNSIS